MNICRSVRAALDEAARRNCHCEAVINHGRIDRAAAEKLVPKGGLLVREGNGRYLPIRLVPKPKATTCDCCDGPLKDGQPHTDDDCADYTGDYGGT